MISTLGKNEAIVESMMVAMGIVASAPGLGLTPDNSWMASFPSSLVLEDGSWGVGEVLGEWLGGLPLLPRSRVD